MYISCGSCAIAPQLSLLSIPPSAPSLRIQGLHSVCVQCTIKSCDNYFQVPSLPCLVYARVVHYLNRTSCIDSSSVKSSLHCTRFLLIDFACLPRWLCHCHPLPRRLLPLHPSSSPRFLYLIPLPLIPSSFISSEDLKRLVPFNVSISKYSYKTSIRLTVFRPCQTPHPLYSLKLPSISIIKKTFPLPNAILPSS